MSDVGFPNNGISVNELTSRIIKKYDQNKDGIINVSDDSFLRKAVESSSLSKDEVVIKTESRGLLFTDADKNKDGSVTHKELYEFIDTEFDKDNDGEITTSRSILDYITGKKSEFTNFENRYEERVSFKLHKK